MNRIKKAEMCFRALELLDQEAWSCVAIDEAVMPKEQASQLMGDAFKKRSELSDAFAYLFNPAIEGQWQAAWLNNDPEFYQMYMVKSRTDPPIRAWRETALCFAAAMALTGDLR